MATRLLSIQQQPAMEFTGEISEAAARSDKLFRIYHFFQLLIRTIRSAIPNPSTRS
jgi:hypothetical protein